MGETFTIQISSNLVNRLSGNADKSKRKTKKSKSKNLHEPPQSHAKALQKSVTNEPVGAGWPLQPSLFIPVTPPTPPSPPVNTELESIQYVLRDSERVLERVQKQETDMVQEVTQRAKELREKEFKLPYQKPMPCLAEKNSCLECYKEHAKNPLKCADVVKRFAECATKARQQVTSPL